MAQLKNKFRITADLKLLTGMHIGASSDFAPIGAVDSIVIRDPLTKWPLIPGSSLKGKMRSLLAKILNNGDKNHLADCDEIKKLFGGGGNVSRLQFIDLKMANKDDFTDKTDLLYTEIKFENTIDRIKASANPRQLERVPAGAKFKFSLVYNLENVDKQEITKDFENIAKAFKLLQLDYIGGSGTRGYGRVKFDNFEVKTCLDETNTDDDALALDLQEKLKEVENVLLIQNRV